jgi:hypothetical protein
MTSRATRRFWKCYHDLPEPVQRLAMKITGFGAATLRLQLNDVARLDRVYSIGNHADLTQRRQGLARPTATKIFSQKETKETKSGKILPRMQSFR